MKCEECLSSEMVRYGLVKPDSVDKAILKAKDAITITAGKALCKEHYAGWLKL